MSETPEIEVEKPVVEDKPVDTGEVNVPGEVDAEPEVTEEPEKDSFGGRIKELTDKVRSNKQESDAQLFEARTENERLQKELESRPLVQEPLKTLEDFEFDESKYRNYLDERTHDIATKAAESVGSKIQTEHGSRQILASFRAREAEFTLNTKDYESVVYGEVNGLRSWGASDAMADEIRISDVGPQLSYYLAKNPDIAAEIHALSHDETVRRMTLLGSSLKSEMSKKSKTVSDAPPPTPKIPSGEQNLSKDPGKMSDSEFAKWRRKQIASR